MFTSWEEHSILIEFSSFTKHRIWTRIQSPPTS